MKKIIDLTTTTLGNKIDSNKLVEGCEVNGIIKPILGVGNARVSVRVPIIGFVLVTLHTPTQSSEHIVCDMGAHWELMPAEAIIHHLP